MRVPGLLYALTVMVCLSPVAWSAEQQTEPFHKHHDSRHGHDHYYPDRGAIVRDLPAGTIGTSYAGVSYRYHDGIWLEPRGPAYMVVSPPIGLLAPTLPLYSTVVTHGQESYLYCNDTYYKPRPDLGGYEVVNDPSLESAGATQPAPDALVGGQMPGAAAVGTGVVAGTAVGTMTSSPGVAGTAAGGIGGAVVPAVSREAGGAPAAVAPAAPGTGGPAVAREPGLAGGAMPGGGTGGASTPSATGGASTAGGASMSAAPGGASTAGVALTAEGTSRPAAAAGSAVAGTASAAGTSKVPKVFLYPKSGQSAEQQARDRYDCYRFAVTQSGFDPMRTTAAAPSPTSEQQSDFDRAQGACFEGHGYSIR